MLKGEGIAARTLLHLMQSELARREDRMFLAEQMDVANTAYIYTFGCVGIVFSVLLIVLGIIFMARKVDLNYSFGYRSFFLFPHQRRGSGAIRCSSYPSFP